MAKQLRDWLNEFVQNGADPNNVTDWPENAGSGGGIDFSPLVAIEAGQKLVVDFSKGSYDIVYRNDYDEGTYVSNNVYTSNDFEYGTLQIMVAANEDATQLVAYLTGYYNNYVALTDQIVIYNGAALTGEPSSTDLIDYAWPTVEFTIDTQLKGKAILSINDGYSITNGQPQPKPDKPELPSGFVLFEEGQTLKVNFNRGSYIIAYAGEGTNATNIIDECIPTGGFSSGNPQILVQANEEKTQLIASLADPSSYQSLTNQVVIYEGDLTGMPSNTSQFVDYTWPTVEFTISDMENTIIATIYSDFLITN